jgi:hypothetical protein
LLRGTRFAQDGVACQHDGDAAVSGIPVVMNIGLAVYRHTHL